MQAVLKWTTHLNIYYPCTVHVYACAHSCLSVFKEFGPSKYPTCNGLCGQQFRIKLFVRLKMSQRVSQMISFVIAYGFPFDCIGKHLDQLPLRLLWSSLSTWVKSTYTFSRLCFHEHSHFPLIISNHIKKFIQMKLMKIWIIPQLFKKYSAEA